MSPPSIDRKSDSHSLLRALRLCADLHSFSSGIVVKRGYLAILRDPTSNQWTKFFAVFRRPYLHLFASTTEKDEVSVINLSTVKVEQTLELETMLNVSHSF